MKQHYGSLKHKPKKPNQIDVSQQIPNPLANSVDGALPKNGQIGQEDYPRTGAYTNRYLEDIRAKEVAKQKLIKMSAYQKNIHELYMPKPSEKLKNLREQ